MAGNIIFKRIDHVEIVPSNLEKSVAFYIDILGGFIKQRIQVQALRQWGDYVVEEIVYVTLGDTMIEFIGVANPSSTKHDPWGVGYRMIALEVDDMDVAVAYLKTKNVELTTGPAILGKSKRAEIVDPDGLPIELRQW